MLPTVTLWLWMFPVDSPQPSQFLCQLCDSTMSACLFQRHFSNRFLHCINYIIYVFTRATNIYTLQDVNLYFFFSNFTQWFQALAKGFIVFIYVLYYFLFYPNQRCRLPIKGVSQVLCLERLWSQTYFLRFETKFSQFFFFTVRRITFYFLIILQIPEDRVKVPFCVTTSFMSRFVSPTIHFPLKGLWLKYYREE